MYQILLVNLCKSKPKLAIKELRNDRMSELMNDRISKLVNDRMNAEMKECANEKIGL